MQKKINSIAKRPSLIPTEDKQINLVIFAPIDKIIVRRNTCEFDTAVGDDYPILFIVIKLICFLMHSQLESVEFGVAERPGAEPNFLILKVKGLRCRDIGVEGCLRPQQPGCQTAGKKMTVWRDARNSLMNSAIDLSRNRSCSLSLAS